MQILEETSMQALDKARQIGPEGVLKLLEKKGLVGRGGAAFATHKKWRYAIDNANAGDGETFLVCNADEGEPGTFKDKFIIKYNPSTLIEGMLIAAYTVGAKEIFLYLRGEYQYLKQDLQKQIDKTLELAHMDVKFTIVLGAGAYICGEETAILQSIMGFRGHAMAKPPYPTKKGLWGKPTVINNVETLTCVAQAILFDDWDSDIRLFSISGNVQNPGVYEYPLGVKMSTLIEIARPKRKLKAMSFGMFGGIMPINLDMEITPATIKMEECQHGAYSLIFIDETNNVVDICKSIAKFYTYESCGKCTPCREGTIRMLNFIKKIQSGKFTDDDLKLIEELGNHIQETSLCGLGQTSANHVLTALKHFRKDFEAYKK
jgi:NADH:ubiquinone oxidoreductase subunit F (NADH-binding)